MNTTEMETKTQKVSVVERLSHSGWWEAIEWRLNCWLVRGLICLGVNRNPRAMVRVYRVSPALMGLILFVSESGRASNQIHLYWDGSETPTDFDDLMNDIAELIEHAPTPMGADDYSVGIYRLARLPGDEAWLDEARLEATLRQRKIIASWRVWGDRYYDWKRREGKANVRALLEEADPTPGCPVTIIEVICTGRAIARTVREFEGQRQE
jgi:hypothetical protein